MEKRSSFSGRIGFVLAAAGSAVGLGNIWRFPYLAAQYGGGIFLLVYLILVVSFGFTIMTAEIAIGRKTGLSAIGAFKALNKKYAFIGILATIVPIIILPYYSVIGGWVMKYCAVYITGQHSAAADGNFFSNFTSSTVEPLVWFLLFVAVTFVIVLLGVKHGIEVANKFLMPVLLALSVFVAIYSATLPGALDGIKFYLLPDFSRFSAKTVLAAMGQMFYSMSLAMGIMITYGSYLKKDTNIEKSVKQIEYFDTGVAFLAGMMVIPAFFAFSNGDTSSLNAGPSLMFITLPKVFEEMGMSTVVGIGFFVLVLFAALTSSISLMETIVSIVIDKFKLKRSVACLLVFGLVLLMGIPSSLGFGAWSGLSIGNMTFLDIMDFISNSVLMPIVAFLTCIFVAYVIGTKAVKDEVKLSSEFKREKVFDVMIKYIAPICIIAILVTSVLDGFDIFNL